MSSWNRHKIDWCLTPCVSPKIFLGLNNIYTFVPAVIITLLADLLNTCIEQNECLQDQCILSVVCYVCLNRLEYETFRLESMPHVSKIAPTLKYIKAAFGA
jgi:hypothetical protein